MTGLSVSITARTPSNPGDPLALHVNAWWTPGNVVVDRAILIRVLDAALRQTIDSTPVVAP